MLFISDDTIAVEILALKFSMINDYGLEYYFQILNNDENTVGSQLAGTPCSDQHLAIGNNKKY